MPAQSSTPNTLITEEAIQDPATMCQRFHEACNAGELDRALRLYEPDAVIVERTGELGRGTEAIRGHLARLLAMKPTMHTLSSKTIIHGDLAQSSTHWTCEALAPDGTPVHLEYHASELSRRQPDGSWRILIDNAWGAY